MTPGSRRQVLNLRTTTTQKCAAVPRRARKAHRLCVSLNSSLESNKEEKKKCGSQVWLSQHFCERQWVCTRRLPWSLTTHSHRRRCSRDTYPESCITKYTSIRRSVGVHPAAARELGHPLPEPRPLLVRLDGVRYLVFGLEP